MTHQSTDVRPSYNDHSSLTWW